MSQSLASQALLVQHTIASDKLLKEMSISEHIVKDLEAYRSVRYIAT